MARKRFTGRANKTVMALIGRPGDFNSFELMEPIFDHLLDVYIKADRAAGFFHLAVLVDNFDEKVGDLKAKGCTVIVEETVDPFPGCELLREAYIMPEDSTRGILFALIDARTFPASEGGWRGRGAAAAPAPRLFLDLGWNWMIRLPASRQLQTPRSGERFPKFRFPLPRLTFPIEPSSAAKFRGQ
jgi:hypothetical protein